MNITGEQNEEGRKEEDSFFLKKKHGLCFAHFGTRCIIVMKTNKPFTN